MRRRVAFNRQAEGMCRIWYYETNVKAVSIRHAVVRRARRENSADSSRAMQAKDALPSICTSPARRAWPQPAVQHRQNSSRDVMKRFRVRSPARNHAFRTGLKKAGRLSRNTRTRLCFWPAMRRRALFSLQHLPASHASDSPHHTHHTPTSLTRLAVFLRSPWFPFPFTGDAASPEGIKATRNERRP